MKIIINESQLRLIVENEEKKERLLTITTDMIEESFDEILDLYNSEKEKKNFVGIRLLGSVDFSRGFDNKTGAVEFCNELVEVNGDLIGINNYVIGLPKLRKVSGDMRLSMTDIRSLPELRYVGGRLDLSESEIKSLPMLSEVKLSLFLQITKIESLPELKSVGGSLDLYNAKIKSLPKLEYVGTHLDLGKTPLSKTTTKEELRKQINISGEIYL